MVTVTIKGGKRVIIESIIKITDMGIILVVTDTEGRVMNQDTLKTRNIQMFDITLIIEIIEEDIIIIKRKSDEV